MFTTCVSCDRDLGRNAELPGFPVGRRIAFDTETGRLWVICLRCDEWNLGLLETRWEAVEAAERLARKAEARVSIGSMAMARTTAGLELLRVGGASRTDIANWRYGRLLKRRRRWTYAAIAMLALPVSAAGAWATHVGGNAFAGLYLSALLSAAVYWFFKRVPLTVLWGRTPSRRRWFVWGFRLRDVRVDLKLREGRGVLLLPGLLGTREHVGRDAMEVLAQLLARRSWVALAEADLPDAVAWVDSIERRLGKTKSRNAWRRFVSDAPGGRVMDLPVSKQLALEMALREELERLDMEREARIARDGLDAAQEVGRISDDLLLPQRILDWIRARRR